jgi:hypothetical protein
VFAICFDLFGVTIRFGASTVMVGSGAAEPVAVCGAAGPHSKTVDKAATAEGTTKLDDNLITMSSQSAEIVLPVNASNGVWRRGMHYTARRLGLGTMAQSW